MIARLRGTAAGRTPDGLVVDVGGVGYLVAATPSVLGRAETGAEVTVETYLHDREDALQLYGFHEAVQGASGRSTAKTRDHRASLASGNVIGWPR